MAPALDRMASLPKPVVYGVRDPARDGFLEPAEFAGPLDQGREVPATDVDGAGMTDGPGCEHVADVAVLRRHQAVGGEQDWDINPVELGPLVLPGRPVVALEVAVLRQPGVGVGWQHLPVRVHVDTQTVGLLEQGPQVLEVMPRHDDRRSGLYVGGHLHGPGDAEGPAVGCIEHLHADEVRLPNLHHHPQELIRIGIGSDCPESVVDRLHDRPVRPPQDGRVVGVGSHPTESEQYQGLQ